MRKQGWTRIVVWEAEYRRVRLIVAADRRVICFNAAADRDANIILLLPKRR